MKYKSECDIGEQVKIMFASDVLNMLKILSKDAWLKYYPNEFIELLNDNYLLSLKAVKISPNIYFMLNRRFRNDNDIIRATINSFRKHNRLNEIDYRNKPIRKNEHIGRR